ncbi:hypothetical protein KAR91_53510 [Candidatus Pacearchaeota archaeon]|nr:hypothetical protein [Candidatus Pacearchaeota archaeon]
MKKPEINKQFKEDFARAMHNFCKSIRQATESMGEMAKRMHQIKEQQDEKTD